MGIGAAMERWWGRVAGLEARGEADQTGARRTTATPLPMGPGSVFLPFRGTAGAATLPKPTAVNLRRLAETPAARRAINCIKDRIACMEWRIEARPDAGSEGAEDRSERARRLARALATPNYGDSFRTLVEPVIEDILVGGFGAMEMEPGDAALPVRLYPVDGASIQVNPEWAGEAEVPRFAQVNGRGAVESRTALLDRELMYVRLNPRSHTVFGLGKMEVAFEAINSFLSAHKQASRMASNGTVQYALWLKDRTPEQHERLSRWWQDEVEGSGRVPVISTEEAPQVVRLAQGTDAELRMEWQQFLLTMIANAFDLPPMLLGVTHDVNRSTAQELADEAFQNAVVPVAKLLAEAITRDVITKLLGWDDLRFAWNELESRDEVAEANIQMQLLQAGVLSVDEVRAMRGLPARSAEDAAIQA